MLTHVHGMVNRTEIRAFIVCFERFQWCRTCCPHGLGTQHDLASCCPVQSQFVSTWRSSARDQRPHSASICHSASLIR